jgi:hypothetical protein
MMLSVLRRALSAVVLAGLAACGGGGGDTPAPPPPPSDTNRAPRATILASGDVRPDAAGVNVTLGGLVQLDGTTSADDDNDTLTYVWTLVNRPTGSASQLPSTTTGSVQWHPDVMGAYTLQLRVTDTKGAYGLQNVVVTVDNRAPVPNLVVTPQFTPVPATLPTQAVTLGANVLIDATNSTDPEGDGITVTFDLFERPTGSTAALVVSGRIARLVTDTLGLYRVRVRGTDTRGASFESINSFNANNRAPNPVVVTSLSPVVANAGQSSFQTSVGYDVVLNGTSSIDPDGDVITREWLMTTRPVGSAAALSSATGTTSSFSPDVLGSYVVTLTAIDPRGARSVYTTTIQVNNRRPIANIGSNATPIALPTVPNVRVPVGTEVTLRGSSSVDADGDTLTFAWTVVSRPAGSTAALSSTAVADPRIVVDRDGPFTFRLRVTDPLGTYSERTITLDAGRYAPVAVVDRGRVSIVLGERVRANAAWSFDEDGDPLTYQWTLDARPTGSTAAITSAATADLDFTPDLPGVYAAAVTVSDGHSSSIAYVTVKVLNQITSSVSLNFVPEDLQYSTGLDKLVISAGSTLRVIDPHTAALQTVVLPFTIRRFSVSSDGKLAVALHSGTFSLVDLETATLIRTTSAESAPSEAFVSDSGIHPQDLQARQRQVRMRLVQHRMQRQARVVGHGAQQQVVRAQRDGGLGQRVAQSQRAAGLRHGGQQCGAVLA